VPAGGQRSFEEARGFVVNDYQQVLEQQWIDRLRKRYPVVVNQQVLKGL
jgi:peptidyl-prolyl cis-trans isomerase SurA